MKKLFIILPLVSLLLTSCGIIKFNSGTKTNNAAPQQVGFYKTINRGDTWLSKSSIYTTGGKSQTFSGFNITTMTTDPQDENTLYLGTETKGILYSYNRGEGWMSTVPGSGVVNAIAVDPLDKCTIYSAIFNKIYKSTDCARSWQQIHFSTLAKETYITLAIDPTNGSQIYLGTSAGSLIVSSDAGFSWQATKFFPSRISKIIVNPNKSNIIYLATLTSGIYRSEDTGQSWENLNEREVSVINEEVSGQARPLKDFKGSKSYLAMAFDSSQPDGLLFSNNYGIFRLDLEGNWSEIMILNKPKEEKVISLAINHANGQEIFFTTAGAYYFSLNGGVDWTVKNIPTVGSPTNLIVQSANSQEAYITFYQAKK